MNLAALPVTQSMSPKCLVTDSRATLKGVGGTLVVVISGDGEMLTSGPSSVAGEMLPVRTALTIVVTLMIYYNTNNFLMFIRLIKSILLSMIIGGKICRFMGLF